MKYAREMKAPRSKGDKSISPLDFMLTPVDSSPEENGILLDFTEWLNYIAQDTVTDGSISSRPHDRQTIQAEVCGELDAILSDIDNLEGNCKEVPNHFDMPALLSAISQPTYHDDSCQKRASYVPSREFRIQRGPPRDFGAPATTTEYIRPVTTKDSRQGCWLREFTEMNNPTRSKQTVNGL